MPLKLKLAIRRFSTWWYGRGPCCPFGCYDAITCGHALAEQDAMRLVIQARLRTSRRVWRRDGELL